MPEALENKWLKVAGPLALLLLAGGLYAAFFVAPTERTMGNVQRIFYFHASSGWIGGLAFLLNAVGSVVYLATRRSWWDSFAVAAGEAGVVLCTGVLLSGPLWAKPVWGIWWTWDARLSLTLLCWMLYVAYLMLRSFLADPARRALISAVFAIFAFADVPIVYMAIRWWRTQHPQPVIAGGEGSGLDPTMRAVFYFCVLALGVMTACFMMYRLPIEEGQRRIETLRRQLRIEEPA